MVGGSENRENTQSIATNFSKNTPCRIVFPAQIIASKKLARNTEVHALYSSTYGGIILDSEYMVIPFADHMVHRGHAVFDTATLINGRVYQLDPHLQRLLKSIAQARIKMTFEIDEIKNIILQTCAASGQQNAVLRFWLSAGGIDFNIAPSATGEPSFWVAVLNHHGQINGPVEEFHECTIPFDVVPLKPSFIATVKTTNYFLNALCAMEAQNRGGKMGIWIDEQGCLAEASIASIAIVTKDGCLLIPAFGRILAGITMTRVLDLVEEQLKRKEKIEFGTAKGILREAQQRNVTVAELRDAAEIVSLSGDVLINSIVMLDKKPVGNGMAGSFAKWLRETLMTEARLGFFNIDSVPYELYTTNQTR